MAGKRKMGRKSLYRAGTYWDRVPYPMDFVRAFNRSHGRKMTLRQATAVAMHRMFADLPWDEPRKRRA